MKSLEILALIVSYYLNLFAEAFKKETSDFPCIDFNHLYDETIF